MTKNHENPAPENNNLKDENTRLEGALNEALSQRDMALERLLQLSAELQLLKAQLEQSKQP
jgi:hypothetical protein